MTNSEHAYKRRMNLHEGPEQPGKKPMQIFVASFVVSFVDLVSDKARDKARDKVFGTRPHGMKLQTIKTGHSRRETVT